MMKRCALPKLQALTLVLLGVGVLGVATCMLWVISWPTWAQTLATLLVWGAGWMELKRFWQSRMTHVEWGARGLLCTLASGESFEARVCSRGVVAPWGVALQVTTASALPSSSGVIWGFILKVLRVKRMSLLVFRLAMPTSDFKSLVRFIRFEQAAQT
jgi:hypothetical protein